MTYDKESYQKWYKENPKTQVQRVHERRLKMRQWLDELKSTLKCSRCDESHPATLDFHHRDPKEKEFVIGYAISGGWGKKRILAEIEKCEVLCANCHRKEHYDPAALAQSGGAPVL